MVAIWEQSYLATPTAAGLCEAERTPGWALPRSLFVLSCVSSSHLPPQGLVTVLATRKSGACGDAMPLDRLQCIAAWGSDSFTHIITDGSLLPRPERSEPSKGTGRAGPLLAIVNAFKA